MTCGHCQMRIEKALNSLDGVEKAVVSLEEKKAVLALKENVADSIIKEAVEDAGYEVIEIK